MKSAMIVVVFCAMAMATAAIDAHGQEKARRTFLSALKEGHTVTLKETSGRFEIMLGDEKFGARGHKVVEVGTDYVVVEDLAGVTERRIPVYSIASIVKLKRPRE